MPVGAVSKHTILVLSKDQATKGLGKIGDALGKVGKIGAALGGAAVVGIGALAMGVAKLAMDAAALEPTRVTFDNLTKSIGSTADSMLDKLRPATMGVVADADLMQAANKLMAMGLAKTEEEAAKLSQMAVTLGTAMGENATNSMENFALMMANQSIPRLDSFGISSGKVRERIKELQEATADMSREEAFKIAVMEQGAAAMERVGDVSGTTGVAMQQVNATIKNIKDSIGQAFLPILAKLLTPLGKLAQEYGPRVSEWAMKFAVILEEKAFPILAKVGDFIGRNLGPTMEVLGNILSKVVIPALTVLWNILQKVWSVLQPIVKGISGALGGLLTKIGLKGPAAGTIPGRQFGGPVTGGRSYMVGELGPEIFTPRSSGMITADGGGGDIVVPITLELDGHVLARIVTRIQGNELRRRGVRAMA